MKCILCFKRLATTHNFLQQCRTVFRLFAHQHTLIHHHPRITSYNVCYTKLLRTTNRSRSVRRIIQGNTVKQQKRIVFISAFGIHIGRNGNRFGPFVKQSHGTENIHQTRFHRIRKNASVSSFCCIFYSYNFV